MERPTGLFRCIFVCLATLTAAQNQGRLHLTGCQPIEDYIELDSCHCDVGEKFSFSVSKNLDPRAYFVLCAVLGKIYATVKSYGRISWPNSPFQFNTRMLRGLDEDHLPSVLALTFDHDLAGCEGNIRYTQQRTFVDFIVDKNCGVSMDSSDTELPAVSWREVYLEKVFSRFTWASGEQNFSFELDLSMAIFFKPSLVFTTQTSRAKLSTSSPK